MAPTGRSGAGSCSWRSRGFERAGHLWPVSLPGRERAIREPWRMACAWLVEVEGAEPPLPPTLAGRIDASRWAAVASLARLGVAAPATTSAGRLFDAVAALCGLRTESPLRGPGRDRARGLCCLAGAPRTRIRFRFGGTRGFQVRCCWTPGRRSSPCSRMSSKTLRHASRAAFTVLWPWRLPTPVVRSHESRNRPGRAVGRCLPKPGAARADRGAPGGRGPPPPSFRSACQRTTAAFPSGRLRWPRASAVAGPMADRRPLG